MTLRFQILLVLGMTLIASGCSVNDSFEEDAFNSLYSDCSMNAAIVFLPSQPELREEHDIILDYRNTSEDLIAFPPDSGVKIYFYDVEKIEWIELNNKMQYGTGYKGYFVVGPSSDEWSSYDIVGISPNLPQDRPKQIRVAIEGHIFRDNKVTEECVGAFVDIEP